MKPTYPSDERTDGRARNTPSVREDNQTHTEIKKKSVRLPQPKIILYNNDVHVSANSLTHSLTVWV